MSFRLNGEFEDVISQRLRATARIQGLPAIEAQSPIFLIAIHLHSHFFLHLFMNFFRRSRKVTPAKVDTAIDDSISSTKALTATSTDNQVVTINECKSLVDGLADTPCEVIIQKDLKCSSLKISERKSTSVLSRELDYLRCVNKMSGCRFHIRFYCKKVG